MLRPSIFGERLLDDWRDFPFGMGGQNGLMKTDICDTDNSYELSMDMPGFQKEDIKVEFKEGYLTVSAATSTKHDEKDKEGRYIRRERYTGSCSRSFYVGEDVKQEEIRAKFENGILKLSVPKKKEQPKVEEERYISIEG